PNQPYGTVKRSNGLISRKGSRTEANLGEFPQKRPTSSKNGHSHLEIHSFLRPKRRKLQKSTEFCPQNVRRARKTSGFVLETSVFPEIHRKSRSKKYHPLYFHSEMLRGVTILCRDAHFRFKNIPSAQKMVVFYARVRAFRKMVTF
ncbi:MAG: hypothetical protein JWM68_4519, partial [Verrucomicrobiales bacterium]|nr:hypothetical protein [Verrucomicrobiales bacterium]